MPNNAAVGIRTVRLVRTTGTPSTAPRKSTSKSRTVPPLHPSTF